MAVKKDKKRGTWYVKYHTSSGYITRRGFRTKHDAQDAEREIITGTARFMKYDLSFKDAFCMLLNEVKQRPSLSSYVEYSSKYKKHIEPFFPNKKLSKYKRSDIVAFQAVLKAQGRSPYMINRAVTIISMTMTYAVRNGYIGMNPFTNPPKLKNVKTPHEFLDYSEFQRFIQAIDTSDDALIWGTLFRLMYFNGLRRSENLALQWKDIDFKNARIKVHQHVIFYKYDDGKDSRSRDIRGKYDIVPGRKNAHGKYASYYYSEIDRDTLQHLERYHENQMKLDGYTDDYFVFGGIRPIPPNTLRVHLKNGLKKAGLKDVNVHSFRHSAVSFLYNYCNTLSIQDIADRIGDTVQVCLSTYSHIFEAPKGKYSNAIEDAVRRLNSEEKQV